jgi:23S rRNA pseudouridine1911/1915/1917 synthase
MLQPEIIYEDENLLAINKPAGLMVHPAKIVAGKIRGDTQAESTVVDWLIENRPQVKIVGDDPATRPGIVHRLDKDTSGVMLIAKTQEYFEYLKSLFQKHEIAKTYYAIVRGVPKRREGIIDAPIGIINGTLKRSIRSSKMKKEAVTEYKILKVFNETEAADTATALLEVHPRTGRTHQIRVHLASIGHPIVGDKLYGPRQQPKTRLMLHAAAIEFRDNHGRMMHLSTDPPFGMP